VGNSPNDIWAVGINGLMVHFDGSTWSLQPAPTTRNLFAVWGRAANDMYAVGNTGAVVHFDGVRWRELTTSATGQNLRGVWGDNRGTLVAAGWDGTVIRGAAGPADWVTEISSPTLVTAWGAGDGTVYAGGGGGALLKRSVGTGWGPSGLPPSQTIYGIHGSGPQNIVAVGDTGTIWRFNGSRWSAESSPRTVLLRSVWVPVEGTAFIVGDRGVILEQRGTGWGQMRRGRPRSPRGDRPITCTPSATRGSLRLDGTQWRPMPTPTRERSAGCGDGPTTPRCWRARDDSALRRRPRYAMPSGTTVALRGVWGSGPVDVYAVGEGGLLLRFDGAQWTRLNSPTDALLIQAWGEPGQGRLFVVGTVMTILRGERQ
jgi:hypothetical protein